MNRYSQYFTEIRSLLGKSFNKIYIFIALTIFISILDLLGLSLIVPYISFILELSDSNSEQMIIKYFSNFDYRETIFYLSFSLIFIYILKVILSIYILKSFIGFSLQQGSLLRIKLARTYINSAYEDFIEKNSSEYIYSVETLTTQFSNSILPSVLRFFSDLFIFFTIIIFLIFINWVIVIALFVLLAFIMIFYDAFFKRKLKIAGEKSNFYLTKLIKSINEIIDGFKEIKIFSKDNFFINKIEFLSNNYAKVASFGQIVALSPKYILELLVVFFVVICILGATLLNINLNNLLPTLGVFAFAALRLAPASTLLISNLSTIRSTRHSLKKLYEDILLSDEKAIVKSNVLKKNLNSDNFFSSYELSNIDFKYKGSNNYIFKNISFRINRGENIRIIGASGSGKTTLLDILLGFLKVQKGTIKYNGVPMPEDFNFFRSKVAYLPQKIFLTDDTLKNNVALGINPNEIDENKVIKALNKARLGEFLANTEYGIDTMIGEKGIKISGGQKQRIAIARAFYYNREILILDESTNSLDKQNEMEILSEIKKLSKDVTLIIISHDDTLVKFCNKILKIDKENIIESIE